MLLYKTIHIKAFKNHLEHTVVTNMIVKYKITIS